MIALDLIHFFSAYVRSQYIMYILRMYYMRLLSLNRCALLHFCHKVSVCLVTLACNYAHSTLKDTHTKVDTGALRLARTSNYRDRQRKGLSMTIAQNEWTSLAIHDRRSGKFNCTSAFNKLALCIREERASFGPQASLTHSHDFVSPKITKPRTENWKWTIYQWFRQKK